MNATAWRLCVLLTCAILPGVDALAHARPEFQSPGAGDVLTTAPTEVRIRFDAQLEAPFCELIVKDASNKVVSDGKATVDEQSHKWLSVKLTSLASGSYHVYWVAVSRDGHRTRGDYSFTVN